MSKFISKETLIKAFPRPELKTGQEITLKSGIKVKELSLRSFLVQFSDYVLGDQRWPIYEQFFLDKAYINCGASICLIVYIIGKNISMSGHFNVVMHPSEQAEIANLGDIADIKVYQSMLKNLKEIKKSDPKVQVVLFGQHYSYMKCQVEETELANWILRKEAVLVDLIQTGITPQNTIDLRGGVYGAVHTGYSFREKTIYFAYQTT